MLRRYSLPVRPCLAVLLACLLAGCKTSDDVAPGRWSDDFESRTVGTAYQGHDDLRVQAGCGPLGDQCLRTRYRPTERGSVRLGFLKDMAPADDYTLNYDVYFEDGFEFVRGGKLPGLAARTATAGCAAVDPGGWSVRLTWRREGQISIYYYDQERPNACGQNIYGGDFRFRTDRWYALSLYVRVNDPGVANGVMALYIDGELVAEKRDTLLRSIRSDRSRVGRFYFATFFGGSDPSWAPSATVYSRFDNFNIAPGLVVRQRSG